MKKRCCLKIKKMHYNKPNINSNNKCNKCPKKKNHKMKTN